VLDDLAEARDEPSVEQDINRLGEMRNGARLGERLANEQPARARLDRDMHLLAGKAPNPQDECPTRSTGHSRKLVRASSTHDRSEHRGARPLGSLLATEISHAWEAGTRVRAATRTVSRHARGLVAHW